MSEELKLLPCPFCGGEAAIGGSYSQSMGRMFVAKCDSCGISSRIFYSKPEAIAAWNRRPKPRTNFERWWEKLTPDKKLSQNCESCSAYPCNKRRRNTCEEAFYKWANAEVGDESV